MFSGSSNDDNYLTEEELENLAQVVLETLLEEEIVTQQDVDDTIAQLVYEADEAVQQAENN
jgi:membrane peptidoglycan carboxypeptidase